MSPSPIFFDFEADFVESLRCIPMVVRFKLDTCGVKLKLHHWNQFSPDERQQLAQRPCQDVATAAAYGNYVQGLVSHYTGVPAKTLPLEPHPPWENPQAIPPEVVTQTAAERCTIFLDQWQALDPLQRFALIKLSRPSHENKNFYPALVEFGLVDG
ncbi:MAG: nitrate reductase associated protein [Leptolyngbya sp. LCM1.Bin17]|nr:MAG: nitrate reductase associated protein [Leptolyngbya sp. LCM1.Bin17]